MSSTDRLMLVLTAPGNPLFMGVEALGAFIEALEQHIGELRPTVVEGVEQRGGSSWPYTRENFRKAVAEVRGAPHARQNVFFERQADPYVRLSLNFEPEGWNLLLEVRPLSFFAEGARGAERSRRLVELVRAWASWYPVHEVTAHSAADGQLARVDAPFGLATEVLPREVSWLQVLGPKQVAALGRERVLSTPAFLVEPLPPGNVLLVTRPGVADCLSEEARQAQARALVHLRPELRLEEVLARLGERSRVLAPVEPDFDPDVAGLLDCVVQELELVERPRKVAELNAWRAAEVDEWRPLEAVLPPDVESVARELVRYRRQWPRALREKVEAALPFEPASLLEVDRFFWWHGARHAYGHAHLVRYLAPMAGAFLGEVLVRSLGGYWIPRKNLSEAQVVVDERVYLPFLRAQRYFQSRQAVLDRSLTKLFRVAERQVATTRSP